MRHPVSFKTFVVLLVLSMLLALLLFAPSLRYKAQQTQACLESGGVPAQVQDGKSLCLDPDALITPGG